MKKLKADSIAGLFCMAFGLFFLINTITNPQMSFIATTSDGVPGGGFFPYILSVLIIILGGALVVRGTKTEGPKIEMNEEKRKNLRVMLLTVAGLIVFLAVWNFTADYFGNTAFLACVFLFEIYLNKLFERTWKFALIYAVIFTAFIYLVFNMGFSIQFTA